MEPFILEAKHMIDIKETAFPKDTSTYILRDMIREPNVKDALKKTTLRFSLVSQGHRAIHLG